MKNIAEVFEGLANVFAEVPMPQVETYLASQGLLDRSWMVDMAQEVRASGRKLGAGEELTPAEGEKVIEFGVRVLLVVNNVAGAMNLDRRKRIQAFGELQQRLIADGRLPDFDSFEMPGDLAAMVQRQEARREGQSDTAEMFAFVELMGASQQ